MVGEIQANSEQSVQPDIEIDFFALLRYAREAWRFILSCVIVAVVLTACSLRNTDPVYESSMIVAPLESNDGGGAQSLTTKVLSSLGGGLAGGSGANNVEFDQFQYKMTSPSVVHAANRDGKLYEWVYPGQWDARLHRWKKPLGLTQFLLGTVRSFFRRPDWTPPDDVMTAEILQKQVVFEAIPKSTLTKVSYQNKNPAIATAMLRRLFAEADSQLRAAERIRLQAQIANANSVLATTQVADFRQAMGQALANAQYHLMNVPDNIDYSANDVETPFVSSLPVSPKIGLSLAVAMLASFVLSAFAAIAYRVAATELRRRGKNLSERELLNPVRLLFRFIDKPRAQTFR